MSSHTVVIRRQPNTEVTLLASSASQLVLVLPFAPDLSWLWWNIFTHFSV